MTISEEGVRTLVALGHALTPKLDLGPVLALGRLLVAEEERPLRHFVVSFVKRPDWHRTFWLGQTALARARLSRVQRGALDLLGADPDLLGPSASQYDEVAHTRTLTWALNHPELAGETRPALLELLTRGEPCNGAPPFDASGIDPAGLCLAAEVVIDAGRVDVWLEGPSDVILVEAKLLAGEGRDQTKRYADAGVTTARGRRWTVVFLTLDPDQQPSGPALHITFRQLLHAWLPIAASGGTGAHKHLGAYLASVGRILGLGRAGTFDEWDFAERRRAIEIVEGGRQ